MELHRMDYTRKAWICVICLLITLDCYFHVLVYYDIINTPPKKRKAYHIFREHHPKFNSYVFYKYPLVNGGDAIMDYKHAYNSSYYWFKSLKFLFKNMGAEATPRYANDTPVCKLNASFGPITVATTEPKFDWIEQQNPDVKLGGYYAPTHCRATDKVAVIIPYRDRGVNLKILLRYLHPLLQKQLLEYRIFVVAQFGTEKFNKGTLYNIAFLETQRFGTWHCLVFHDVDLIPEHEGIPYSCPQRPKNLSPTIEFIGIRDLYRTAFGSVTAVAPNHYEAMDGFSNSYRGPGGGEDFYDRKQSNNIIARYHSSIARYATLPHPVEDEIKERSQLHGVDMPVATGLRSTKYDLLSVTEEKLYTHILADVSVVKITEEEKPS